MNVVYSKLGDAVELLARRSVTYRDITASLSAVEGDGVEPSLACVQEFSLDELRAEVGERSQWLYDLARGVDASEVSNRTRPKSLLSAKNMNATTVLDVHKWGLLISKTLVYR